MVSEAVEIAVDGGFVIPLQFRRMLGLQAGDRVLVELDESGLRIHAPSARVRAAQTVIRTFVSPETSLADELIAERRVEASRE